MEDRKGRAGGSGGAGIRVAAGLVVLLGALWAVVGGVEAEKEIRALCTMVAPGQAWGEVETLFATAAYLETTSSGDAGSGSLVARSPANLGLSSCTVIAADGLVQDHAYVVRIGVAPLAAGVAVGSLVLLVVFQLLLAAGLPLGRLAWGGRHVRLPARLRVGSGLSAVVLAAGAVAAAEWVGWVRVTERPGILEVFLTVLALLFGLSTLANFASSSRPERWTGGPLALLLTCALVALVLSGGAG